MHTVQHPFFLSSAKGSNRSADGSTFTVKCNPPLKIPREALHTRVYCNQASCVYSFPNVTAAANTLSLFYADHANDGLAAIEYQLTLPAGLYANLDAVQDALGVAAVEHAKSRAGSEIDKHIGSGLKAVGSGKCGGRRIRVGGDGTQGIRMRGRGLEAVGAGKRRAIRITE